MAQVTDVGMIGSLPSFLADQMKIITPKRTPPILRTEKILRPLDNTTYSTNGNNIIRLNMMKQNVDFRQAYFKATITLTTTGGTYKRLPQGAWCIIDRLRAVIGAVEDETQFYNRLMTAHWMTGTSMGVESSIGQDLLGLGTQADRNAYGADVNGTEYVIPIRLGLLYQGIFPLKSLLTPTNGQNMFVELTLANAAGVIETDGTNPQFTVTNVQWMYEEVWSEDGSFERAIQNEIGSGSLMIGYNSWAVYQNSVLNNSNDLPIQWRGASLNSILTQLVDDTSKNNPLVNDKFSTWLYTAGPGSTVQSFQTQLNTVWSPPEAIDCTNEAIRPYMQLLKWQGEWSSDGYMKFPSGIDLESFRTTNFLMVADFHSIPRSVWDRLDQSVIFNNVSTRSSSINTLFRLSLSAPPAVGTVAYHLVSFNTLVSVDRQGILSKYV